jgi:hypothetical protein
MRMNDLFVDVVKKYLNDEVVVDCSSMTAYVEGFPDKREVVASVTMGMREDEMVFFGAEFVVKRRVSLLETSKEELRAAFFDVFGERYVKR